jgi:hypothetical protein
MITIEDFSATKTLNFQFLPELNVIFYMIVGLQYTVVFSMASMTRIIVFLTRKFILNSIQITLQNFNFTKLNVA